MMIDTREELINALYVACEIEHSLLVQYLYTAMPMKRGLDEGLTLGVSFAVTRMMLVTVSP
jgi:hypothetical protein